MSLATATLQSLASVEELTVTHGEGEGHVKALDGVTLQIQEGETLALWGRSGSGKTTLLHALGGLIEPTSGTVWWQGEPI
jgi:putative ABC transport system ATP-binding protein